jgi:hypothetical protein
MRGESFQVMRRAFGEAIPKKLRRDQASASAMCNSTRRAAEIGEKNEA